MIDEHSVRARKLAPGVALVAAGAVALSPLAVPPSTPHLDLQNISSAAVQLTANPLNIYGQTISTALKNVAPTITQLTDLVGPTMSPEFLQFLGAQFTENAEAAAAFLNPERLQAYVTGLSAATESFTTELQDFFDTLAANAQTRIPKALEEAQALLAEGNIEGAVGKILDLPYSLTGLSVFPLLLETRNFLKYVMPLPIVEGLVNGGLDSFPVLKTALGLIGPLVNFTAASAAVAQDVLDATETQNTQAAIDAIVAGPGVVLGAVLNGGYGPNLPLLGKYPGLLNPEGTGLRPGGTIAGVLTLAENVLTKLGWTPPATLATSTLAATDTTLAPTKAITLNVTADQVAAPEAPAAEQAPAAEAPAAEAPEAKPVAVKAPAKELVRDSLVAVPGKAGVRHQPGSNAANVVSTLNDRIANTVDKIGDGFKGALGKPKPGKATSAEGAGASSSDAGSDAKSTSDNE